MPYQAVFRREEIKFLLSKRQADNLCAIMGEHMQRDKYRQSTICNLEISLCEREEVKDAL